MTTIWKEPFFTIVRNYPNLAAELEDVPVFMFRQGFALGGAGGFCPHRRRGAGRRSNRDRESLLKGTAQLSGGDEHKAEQFHERVVRSRQQTRQPLNIGATYR